MKENYQQEYINLEKTYWWFVTRRKLIKFLLDTYVVKKSKVLDIGCGPGENMRSFTKYDVIGFEKSDKFVKLGKNKGLKVVKGSFPNTPFKDSEFDCILCLDVFEHIEDDKKGVYEISRVLKDSGIAIISVPTYQWLWGAQDEVNHHKRRYTLGSLCSLLKEFQIVRKTYWNTALFLPSAGAKLISRVNGKNELRKIDPNINTILKKIAEMDNLAIRKGIDLPFGTSAIIVARKVYKQ